MIILIRPHYFASASPRMVRDDSICHYHTKLTYSVHIWHKLCVWVRDLHVPLWTLATGKQHTKEKRITTASKQGTQNVLCVCVAAKEERKKKKKQTRNRKSAENLVCVAAKATACCRLFADLLLLCCCCVIFALIFVLIFV